MGRLVFEVAVGIGFFIEDRSADRVIKDREDDIEKIQTAFGNTDGKLQGWMKIANKIDEILQLL